MAQQQLHASAAACASNEPAVYMNEQLLGALLTSSTKSADVSSAVAQFAALQNAALQPTPPTGAVLCFSAENGAAVPLTTDVWTAFSFVERFALMCIVRRRAMLCGGASTALSDAEYDQLIGYCSLLNVDLDVCAAPPSGSFGAHAQWGAMTAVVACHEAEEDRARFFYSASIAATAAQVYEHLFRGPSALERLLCARAVSTRQ